VFGGDQLEESAHFSAERAGGADAEEGIDDEIGELNSVWEYGAGFGR
jgi:hypothetical protein